jgi:N-succinyl-L-ornithine transcarbamylase
MKHFLSINDVEDVKGLVQSALALKQNPFAHKQLGQNKTLGLIFLNPSLRTRLSTQRAAQNLGMNVIVMNMDKEGWALETQDGVVMNHNTVEHIREAAAVMGQYCEIIGVRAFPKLVDVKEDYSEDFIQKFVQHSKVPIVSLESATLHPLQSLADVVTIEEYKKKDKPKVVLTWAPHIKSIPHCVANSFAQWMNNWDVDFCIANPKGYDLAPEFVGNAKIYHKQEEALKDADFVYVKNWSSYHDYGKVLPVKGYWMMDNDKIALTNDAKVMHCLPVRRGIELSDEILDGPNSLVVQEASNRVWAAQAVLKNILEQNFAG